LAKSSAIIFEIALTALQLTKQEQSLETGQKNQHGGR
jgi:hypothetical protein